MVSLANVKRSYMVSCFHNDIEKLLKIMTLRNLPYVLPVRFALVHYITRYISGESKALSGRTGSCCLQIYSNRVTPATMVFETVLSIRCIFLNTFGIS